MLAADSPPAVAAAPVAKPADLMVVSSDAHSEILASQDTPMLLVKARKTEDALLRQAITLTSTLTVVRPASGAGADVVRWNYQTYLQRQLCLTSITGHFTCAIAEVEELTEKGSGEAPLAAMPAQAALDPAAPVQVTPNPTAPNSSPEAESARATLAAALHDRSAALFEDDRRLKLDPMLKAAGVSIRRTPPQRAASPAAKASS